MTNNVVNANFKNAISAKLINEIDAVLDFEEFRYASAIEVIGALEFVKTRYVAELLESISDDTD